VAGYRSENHIILYQSSEYLLRQWAAEDGLDSVRQASVQQASVHAYMHGDEDQTTHQSISFCRTRVVAFLKLKLKHGFCEFNSTGYILFTLQAILNLVDFSTDLEISTLSRQCAGEIFSSILAFTMPSGDYFTVTGRGYLKQRMIGRGCDINVVIFLLTGASEALHTCPKADVTPPPLRSAAAFLATSNYRHTFPPTVLTQWKTPTRLSWRIGTSVNDFIRELKEDYGLSGLEFVPFLWSSGLYFHPECISFTVDFLNETAATPGCQNLWKHSTFKSVRHLQLLSPTSQQFIAGRLSSLTSGSSLVGQTVHLFKDSGVLLSTVHSCEAGCVGYQKVPWIAVLKQHSVWTGCGQPGSVNGLGELVSHSSLPATQQFHNIAIVSYHPASFLASMKLGSQVYAHFPLDVGLEVVVPTEKSGNSELHWAFVSDGDNFLGLGCNNLPKAKHNKNLLISYSSETYWVCVVGTAVHFGDFRNFMGLCQQTKGTMKQSTVTVTVPDSLCLGQVPASSSGGTKELVCLWNVEEDHAEDIATGQPTGAHPVDHSIVNTGGASALSTSEEDSGSGGGGGDNGGGTGEVSKAASSCGGCEDSEDGSAEKMKIQSEEKQRELHVGDDSDSESNSDSEPTDGFGGMFSMLRGVLPSRY
jgi:hypothetical protein